MFIDFDFFEQAQEISDQLTVNTIHKKHDMFVDKFCPIIKKLEQHYHWSIMQAEYATDIVFKRQQDLQLIYDNLGTKTQLNDQKPLNINGL